MFLSVLLTMIMDVYAHNLAAQLPPGQLEAAVSEVVTRRRHLLLLLSLVLVQISQLCLFIFSRRAPPMAQHTSILTGQAWVLELITGHPNRIKINFGVSLETFLALVCALNESGFKQSCNGVTVEEQLGIFLYTCVTGLSSQLAAERFQRSTDTITR